MIHKALPDLSSTCVLRTGAGIRPYRGLIPTLNLPISYTCIRGMDSLIKTSKVTKKGMNMLRHAAMK